MDELHQRLESNIRRICEERGIVLSHLPDVAQVSPAHFWNILAGKKSPTLSWLSRVAKALDVEVADLLEKE